MISMKMGAACALFVIGQTLVWFQLNSQFVWDWWKGRPFLATALYSIPAGLCFWLGVKLAYEEMNEVWGPRFLIFCMSYITFPVLTWWLLNESMFTTRTMLCVILSFCIIFVQLFGR